MYTDLTLDKPRRLRFDLAAFKALEDAMGGQPIGAIVSQLHQFSITALCAALWVGFRHEDRKLTRANVEQIVSDYLEAGGSVSTVTKALNDAIGESAMFRSMAATEPEGNAPPEPAAT